MPLVFFYNNRNNNKVDVLHVRLTELHAARQNLPFPPTGAVLGWQNISSEQPPTHYGHR